MGLAELSRNNILQALEQLKSVDQSAIENLMSKVSDIEKLKKDIQEVFSHNGRVYLCGCGATGRLSLLLEFLWREKFGTNQVRAFMAGGDIALVHSLEGFEDYPELGARHLRELGFTKK